MPDTLTVPPLAPAAAEEPALYVCVWDHVARYVMWLDAANGRSPHETAARIMKITEEAGEAVAAYFGVTGANPAQGRHRHARRIWPGSCATWCWPPWSRWPR